MTICMVSTDFLTVKYIPMSFKPLQIVSAQHMPPTLWMYGLSPSIVAREMKLDLKGKGDIDIYWLGFSDMKVPH